MMWNQNDTKYIIKRLILYALISCIVFFGASKCVKASTVSVNTNPVYDSWTIGLDSTLALDRNSGSFFINGGSGYIIYNIVIVGDNTNVIRQVRLGNDNEQFVCDIGSTVSWRDNANDLTSLTLNCPVTLLNNRGIKYIMIQMQNAGASAVYLGKVMSMTSTNSDSQSIVNANSQASQNEINAINNMSSSMQAALGTHATNIINATNQATAQEVAAINASTQATQDNTAAINAQTQWQQQDFQYDSSWADSLNLFGNDTNYIRQLLMWPFTFSLVIGQSLSGGSCNAYTFGSLYGTEITLPCINWKNYVGNTIYTTIDIIMGMVILFGVITYIRKVFEYVFSFGAKAYETVDVEVFK